MCNLFIYTAKEEGRFRLVLASNRDESYSRPARRASRWRSEAVVIGGKDMEPGREGGTWLAMSVKDGLCRVAALLNVTGEPPPAQQPLGRGPIVANYVLGQASAPAYIADLQRSASRYNAFNFVATEISSSIARTYHFSNADPSGEVRLFEQPGQVVGFGNSLPERPLLKIQRGRERFLAAVEAAEDSTAAIEAAIEVLKWEHQHLPDAELQRRAPRSFRELSALFVASPGADYGTRTHTVVCIDAACSHVDFVEETMLEPIDALRPRWGRTHFRDPL